MKGLTMRHLNWLILLGALGAACADARPVAEAGFTARDSAGIHIAENRGPMPESEWTLSPEPLFEIGGDPADPNAQLHNVTSAIRRGNGDFVVANSGTSEILIFDADGRLIGARGRKGEGPGEFPGFGPVSLVSADEKAIVAEYRSFERKLVRFDSIGAATETTSALQTRGSSGDAFTSPGGVGFFVNMPTSSPDLKGADGDVLWIPSMLVRFSYAGEGPDTIARYRGSKVFFADVGPRMTFGGGPAPGPSVLSPLVGSGTASAGGGEPWRVIAGDEGTSEFDVFSEDGTLLIRVRWDVQGREFTDEDRDRIRAHYLADHFARREPQAARRALEVMPRLERTPIYEDLHVDRLGHYWVKRHSLPTDEQQTWWVFEPDGQFAASVAIPLGLRILEVGDDYLLGVARDELDVQRLEMWALQR